MTDSKSPAIWQAPQIPSKWDIIPIHNSDRASFRRCRRYWDWSSPSRHNLTVRADVHGINPNLWFGTGVHYALQAYYTPGLRRDPVEAFKTWFHIQWYGGTVTEDWLDLVYDLKPQMKPDGLFFVRGLEDILPDPDHDFYESLNDLGIGMLEAYKRYANQMDGFEVLVAEHDFSVPIWDYENNCILKRMDTRVDSPNAGKVLEVHARGRMDAIWQKPSGKMGIMDHKTAEKIGEEYFEKLETDEQCTSYLWAAEIEAQYYDLPHKGEQMEEVIYNVLRKAAPRPPTIVRGGLFSVNRNEESCTYDMLMEWITQNEIDISSLSEKHQNYISWLRDVGDEQFIIRKLVRRNRHQLRNAGIRLYLEALDMLGNPRIYPNLSNSFKCLGCAFRAPCLAKESGADWEFLIENNYTVNKDR
jgi:hypothetical protein